MAQSFLKKIILEEIKNVLNEQVGGTSAQAPKSTTFGGPLGPEEKSLKRQSPYFSGKKPKSGRVYTSPVKTLQMELSKLGFLDPKDVDGIPGKNTLGAVRAALNLDLTLPEFKNLTNNDMRVIIEDLMTTDKQKLRKLAVAYRLRDIDTAIAKLTGGEQPAVKEPTATSPESSLSAKPLSPKEMGIEKTSFTRDPGTTKDTGKPKEEEEVDVKLGTKQEALVREISNLIKKL